VRAYFDYNASSLLRPEARTAMLRAVEDGAGNPSSAHGEGRRARARIEAAREQVARLLTVDPKRVVFTSGATESNNTALRGFYDAHGDGVIVTSAIEHPSVLSTATAIERRGARIVRLAVDSDGQPDLDGLARTCGGSPSLVSLGLANGETGHVLDFEAVRAVLGAASLVHLDAAQAVGRVALPPADRFDLLSLSAHKIGGPQGIGALVVPRDRSWPALVTGGSQERAMRAGSENVPGIVGFGAAAEACARSMEMERSRVGALRDALWNRLRPEIPELSRVTPANGLHNTLTLLVPGIASDVLVAGLDLAGFAVSAGSACAAGSPEPSHVLIALGLRASATTGVVRLSLGHATTADEVDGLADALSSVVGRARRAA
jgi:cysteine desulfurase